MTDRERFGRRTSTSASAAAVMLVVLAAVVSGRGQGLERFPAYAGSRLPASAAQFASITRSDAIYYHPWPDRIGYVLDTDGDGRADVADLPSWDAYAELDVLSYAAYVSPSDPNFAYSVTRRIMNGPGGIQRLKRDGDRWHALGMMRFPGFDYDETFFGLDGRDLALYFYGAWSGVLALRKLPGGGDVLLVGSFVKPREYDPTAYRITTKYALLLDGPDEDSYADHWSDVVSIPGYEPITLDDRGNIIARRLVIGASPYNSDAIVRIRDTDGDGLPETVDENGIAATTAPGSKAWGPGDVDLGADRLDYTAGGFVAADLDSRHRPVPGTVRVLDVIAPGLIPWVPIQAWAGHDGDPVCYAAYQPDQTQGIASWRDPDFDGRFVNAFDPLTSEIRGMLLDSDLPGFDTSDRQYHVWSASRAELTEIGVAGEAGHGIRFAGFGEFPNGETFAFRFGSQVFDRVWVGRNGAVSFVEPALGEASLDALAARHDTIAAGWSDRWDASALRVFAGYGPVTHSFATGERVLSFVVEWRNLRVPGWESDRACSMRLILYSDGTYRTDFGALEAGELGDMPIVTGYGGPGASEIRGDASPAAHSWGSAPTGSGAERVLGTEYGEGRPSDVGHRWVRWLGYPERTDAPVVEPEIVDGNRQDGALVFSVRDANVKHGAHVVVDTSEVFPLKRNGDSWIVRKMARSSPSGRTISDIWADGTRHEVRIVNPDGEISRAATLP